MSDRDRKIVDTGWGIKPDDQPSNTAEAGDAVQRSYRYDPTEPDVIRRILLAQRRGFNTANRVRIGQSELRRRSAHRQLQFGRIE